MNATHHSAIIIYEDADKPVEVRIDPHHETVWLSLNQLAEVFGRDKSVISRHLKNIFNTRELDQNSVVAKSATTATDGKTYQVEYFNLDQSVFGEPAYPSVESKAAHLLYFVVKNHPFIDGNKRSAAFLFVDFLNQNRRLVNQKGDQVVKVICLLIFPRNSLAGERQYFSNSSSVIPARSGKKQLQITDSKALNCTCISYEDAAPTVMIGVSNHFEVAILVAITMFGIESGATLAAGVGLLIEVPFMLALARICLCTEHFFPREPENAPVA